jgi:hypothetical protein
MDSVSAGHIAALGGASTFVQTWIVAVHTNDLPLVDVRGNYLS